MKLINIALALLVGLFLAANWALRVDPAQRMTEFFPNMARPVSAQSFSANPMLPNGMTEQPPVAGTVLYHEYRGGEAVNPVANDPKAIERGAVVFANFCLPCHGPTGRGDGTVAQRGFPAPPSLLAQNARTLPDVRLFRIITDGQKNMPSYAAQVAPADRWCVVAYVRSLQRKEK